MLRREDNERITRVGPGTPMGQLWRRFWIPALLSAELPEADCPPVRVKLLGENLVAFRDTAGRVGLVAEHCPHRGASLFFGRNEERGLRCVYHGWKFDVEGRCVDTPNEPRLLTRTEVRATAYPSQERGGLVWTYMGPADHIGELPGLEWTLVPDDHRYVGKVLVECNYLQVMEGDLDNSHAAFLHGNLVDDPAEPLLKRMDRASSSGFNAAGIDRPGIDEKNRRYGADRAPKGMVVNTDYGVMMGWRRNAEDDSYYWSINHWMMPGYTFIASPPGGTLLCNVQVPVDDENTWYYRVTWAPHRPLTSAELAFHHTAGLGYPELIPGTFVPVENKGNDYLIDRHKQRTVSFTGIKSITQQDRGVQESMGPIMDRTREHLASSDAVIINVRRTLLRLMDHLAAGGEPFAASHGAVYRRRAVDVELKRDADWAAEAGPLMAVGGA
jgi:phthalate 4,5-dioxygenase